jgi:YbgC/YbaW family acyl-CoA thioester hydrolase
VAPFDYLFKGRDANHEKTYNEEVDRCPAVKQRIADATRATGYFVTRDYSYRSTQVAGDGWVLVGDAFGFLDPLYSSGVLLALKSGELAADAIVDGLARGDLSAEQLGSWGANFNQVWIECAARVRVLRRLQPRRIRPHVSASSRHDHGLVNRRPLHTARGLSVGTDGIALQTRQGADSAVACGRAGRRSRGQGATPGAADGTNSMSAGPQGFRYRRRVQFSETDLAGIAHFSAFFRFMEEAEHALWRAAGLSIGAAEETGGWPRVAAAFDYKSPLRFEDEFEVTVCLAELTRRSIRYTFTICRDDVLVGTGTMTAVCTRRKTVNCGRSRFPAKRPERLQAVVGAPAPAE